jgi:hypothetical protein
VILPNLQNIELLDFSRNDVMPFLTRSSSIFERLVISFRGRRTLSGDEVADWLDQFPPVSALKITECSGVDMVIGYLASPSLPRLTDLSILLSTNPSAFNFEA